MRISVILVILAILVAPASAQTLKPGDSLNISVLQDPKLDRSVVVDPSGEIAFPLAGHIRARGLTPQALEKILISKLKDNYKDDHLDVTVEELGIAGRAGQDDSPAADELAGQMEGAFE